MLESISPSLLSEGIVYPYGKWEKVHGLNTSSLNGFALFTMLGGDGKYRIGVFPHYGKNHTDANVCVYAVWSYPPAADEIISTLLEVRAR